MSDMATVGVTYEWTLTCQNEALCDSVVLLQELLWTLDGMQTLEEVYRKDTEDVLDYQLDGVNRLEHLEAIKVFSAEPEFGTQVKALLCDTPTFECWELSSAKTISMEDWAESWKQHWQPTAVHERLTICPSWTEYTPKHADERVMILDPGAAFGTGTHETTCLMLQGMYELSKTTDFSRLSVLDVGTGSGILAVYAAQLGCRSILGVDNDPNSLPASKANAEQNGVANACQFSLTPLEDLCHTKHELLLANIIAPVIIALLPEMALRIAPGGHLMLSGLIEKNLPDVLEALKKEGLSDIQTRRLGDWVALDVTVPA